MFSVAYDYDLGSTVNSRLVAIGFRILYTVDGKTPTLACGITNGSVLLYNAAHTS
jgi:hypothetical protein